MIEKDTLAWRYGKITFPQKDEIVGKALRLYGEWAQKEIELLLKLVRPGQTALLGGANIGVQTIALARHLGERGHLVAVEIHPEIYELLNQNIDQNAIKNVTPILAGLWETKGSIQVPEFPNHMESEFNYGSFSLSLDGISHSGNAVELRSIDSLKLKECHLIHLDTEGTELRILNGARRTLENLRPILYVEANSFEEGFHLFQFLKNRGYELFLHSPPAFNPDNYFQNLTNEIFGVAREYAILGLPSERSNEFIPELEKQEDLRDLKQLTDLARSFLSLPYFITKIHWTDRKEAFVENKGISAYMQIGKDRQRATFKLPDQTYPQFIRFTPCDRPGVIKIYSLEVCRMSKNARKVLLSFKNAQEMFENCVLTNSKLINRGLGSLVLAVEKEPHMVFELPRYSKKGEGFILVIAEMSWPHEIANFLDESKLLADLISAKQKELKSQLLQPLLQRLSNTETKSDNLMALGQDLSAQVNSLAHQSSSMRSRIQELEDSLLNGAIQPLSARMDALSQKQAHLENRSEEIKQNLQDLKRCFEDQIADVSTLFDTQLNNRRDLLDLKRDYGEVRTNITEIRKEMAQLLHLHRSTFSNRFRTSLSRFLRHLSSLPQKPIAYYKMTKHCRLLRKSELFDPEYYLLRYPDVREAGCDPARHFLRYGGLEGRNPSSAFNSRYYLSQNPDVREAGINPLIHYLLYGRSEGRSISPLSFHEVKREKRVPFDTALKADWPTVEPPKPIEDPVRIAAEIREKLSYENFVIALSHDNYLESVGGVQICIADQGEKLLENGIALMHLFPANPLPTLAPDDKEFFVSVNINSLHQGTYRVSDFLKILKMITTDLGTTLKAIQVHHLLGWSLESASKLVTINGPTNLMFWLHDYFSICPQYNLLRNDRQFCKAPAIESNSCLLCNYGRLRKNAIPRLQNLFDHTPFIIVAPSECALELWNKTYPHIHCEKLIAPHVRLVKENLSENLPDMSKFKRKKKPRIAFLGHPVYKKGWTTWRRLVDKERIGDHYDLYHLGSGGEDTPETFIPVNVTSSSRYAMIKALKQNAIDIAFLWSIWPETFSYVLYESLCAGCFILTHPNSGNIASYVNKNGHGIVLRNEKDLISLLRDKEKVEELLSQSNERNRTGLRLERNYQILDRITDK